METLFGEPMDPQALARMSSLALAHIGDAVFELLVRNQLCRQGKLTNANLHFSTVRLVNAHAQAQAAAALLPVLTEEEHAVYRRARNAKVHSVPKRAELAEYHAATAFEALLGYVFLKGDTIRLKQLFELAVKES